MTHDRMAVAIVNYNTVDHLRRCLASLREVGVTRVLVKDNGSTDGSVEMVHQEFPDVEVHPDRSNEGYGAGANVAIAASPAPYVLLLNSDTLIGPGVIATLTRHLDDHPRAGIVGPRLHNVDGSLQRSAHRFPRPFTLRPVVRHLPRIRDRSLLTWPHDRARIVPWVKGAALAIRRSAFDEIGGFDPAFFMYFEETDLCYRLGAAGWEVHFTPAAVIVHAGGASTEQRRAEMTVHFHHSMREFYRRHYSPASLIQLDAILKLTTAFIWMRDRLRLAATADPGTAARLEADLEAWERILRGRWPHRARQAAPSPVSDRAARPIARTDR